MSLGITGDGARSSDRIPMLEHMTCPRCGYPMTVREDGREWCSVYGSHTPSAATFRGLVRLVMDCPDPGERAKKKRANAAEQRAIRRLKAVS